MRRLIAFTVVALLVSFVPVSVAQAQTNPFAEKITVRLGVGGVNLIDDVEESTTLVKDIRVRYRINQPWAVEFRTNIGQGGIEPNYFRITDSKSRIRDFNARVEHRRGILVLHGGVEYLATTGDNTSTVEVLSGPRPSYWWMSSYTPWPTVIGHARRQERHSSSLLAPYAGVGASVETSDRVTGYSNIQALIGVRRTDERTVTFRDNPYSDGYIEEFKGRTWGWGWDFGGRIRLIRRLSVEADVALTQFFGPDDVSENRTGNPQLDSRSLDRTRGGVRAVYGF
ncbi:MAG: hypothetical protein HYV13_01205 [Candidatus Doudnabacteria bacterium]|nr:hypothetical protein [Candidatus Doudnabacteria bacterium]